ncbi:flagellar hook-basal body complex protein FliE [Clostridium sp. MSJ-4]|uniref:Flagellar hook-basal body complex protein FliE n=1 Tax=Clostridium simiarum TaxID=2841506 RepID=A0ABS6F0H2_9CLOT|nr:flagellar hook-basal body complex protein FliE [Clostridium simiarum]MBU5591082.1 flagellar hook-basal body complex protein FliE [Clostridium simiarum]
MRINEFVPDSRIFDSIGVKAEENNESGGESFLDVLKKGINEVNDKHILADDMTDGYIKGDDIEVHKVMLATEEAKLSLQMAVQIRNKLVEAYQEINRMQL